VIAKDLLLGRRGDVVTIEPFADLAAAANVLSERRMSYPGDWVTRSIRRRDEPKFFMTSMPFCRALLGFWYYDASKSEAIDVILRQLV
jgi:hypothetical protein